MTAPYKNNDGTTYWINNNKYHRINGPALIWSNGITEWYKNGNRHRIDGPAITFPDGHREWYVNGKRKIKNSSFQKAANLSDEDMTAMILKYGNVE
jgi:hypothetical protein